MILIYAILIIYALLIVAFIIGNYRLNNAELIEYPTTKVSVIIAFKDEEKNIENVVQCLINQEYSKDLLELIFVNDHSEDTGKHVIKELAIKSGGSIKILDLEDKIGKKEALNYGIENATGELLLTTDADCWMGSRWVLSMASEFERTNASFIAGPVGLESNNSIFENLMQIEFAGLLASTSGGFGINKPFMCNGANLCFTRSIYHELKPYESNKEKASGDDVFFLHQVKEGKHKRSFVNTKEAMVKTNGANDIMEFINQRIRWAGKSSSYRDIDTILIGLIVVLTNIGLLVSFYWFLMNVLTIISMLSLFLFKAIFDIILIYSAKRWVLSKNIIINSLLLSFIYPFYSVGIALLSLGFKPKWKGRKT